MEIKKLLILSVLFSTLTFFLGLAVGYMINNYLFNIIYRDYWNLKLMVDSAHYLLREEMVCDKTLFHTLTDYLESVGRRIEILQESKPIYVSKEVFKLYKAEYFNLEYLHYLLANKYINNCNETFAIIFFFYDDSKPCNECKKEGYQLSYLKAKYMDNLLIYSFDISYENAYIQYYIRKYNLTEAPSIILFIKNGSYVFKGFTKYNEIENILSKYLS